MYQGSQIIGTTPSVFIERICSGASAAQVKEELGS